MNKKLKILKNILITLVIIIIMLGIVFFTIDYNKVKNNELPTFCIPNKMVIMDGGTREYFGLGYKVIKYNRLSGYKGIHIGTWFMDYDDNLN